MIFFKWAIFSIIFCTENRTNLNLLINCCSIIVKNVAYAWATKIRSNLYLFFHLWKTIEFLFSVLKSIKAFILPFYFPFSHFLSPFFLFLSSFFLFLLHFPLFSLRLFIFFPKMTSANIPPPWVGGVFFKI